MTHKANTITGVGVGLRTPHFSAVLNDQPNVPWFELLVDNWFAAGGLDRDLLMGLSERYPITFHGVNLSLGSLGPLDFTYLSSIKKLMRDTDACWYSEHCSFSAFGNNRTPDLLPLPYTDETLQHMIQQISKVQDYLGEQILIENVSSYITCQHKDMSEAQFISAVVEGADCGLLLDINNVYVNSVNHGFCPHAYLQQMPADRVKEIHLAGHSEKEGFLLDTHSTEVAPPVWALYADYLKIAGAVPTLIEWDSDIPAWDILMKEQQQAAHYQQAAHNTQTVCAQQESLFTKTLRKTGAQAGSLSSKLNK